MCRGALEYTILFTSIAFAGFFPLQMLVSIMFGDKVVKAIISRLAAFRREARLRTASPLA